MPLVIKLIEKCCRLVMLLSFSHVLSSRKKVEVIEIEATVPDLYITFINIRDEH